MFSPLKATHSASLHQGKGACLSLIAHFQVRRCPETLQTDPAFSFVRWRMYTLLFCLWALRACAELCKFVIYPQFPANFNFHAVLQCFKPAISNFCPFLMFDLHLIILLSLKILHFSFFPVRQVGSIRFLQCSVTCGTGIQQRQVGCHKVTGLGWLETDKVSEGQCFGNEKPAIKQQCVLEPCSSQYHWMTGPWKPVSFSSHAVALFVANIYYVINNVTLNFIYFPFLIRYFGYFPNIISFNLPMILYDGLI